MSEGSGPQSMSIVNLQARVAILLNIMGEGHLEGDLRYIDVAQEQFIPLASELASRGEKLTLEYLDSLKDAVIDLIDFLRIDESPVWKEIAEEVQRPLNKILVSKIQEARKAHQEEEPQPVVIGLRPANLSGKAEKAGTGDIQYQTMFPGVRIQLEQPPTNSTQPQLTVDFRCTSCALIQTVEGTDRIDVPYCPEHDLLAPMEIIQVKMQ